MAYADYDVEALTGIFLLLVLALALAWFLIDTWRAARKFNRDRISKSIIVEDYLGNKYVYNAELYAKRERQDDKRPNSNRAPIDGCTDLSRAEMPKNVRY